MKVMEVKINEYLSWFIALQQELFQKRKKEQSENAKVLFLLIQRESKVVIQCQKLWLQM
ncbi:hypothetical protein SAMN05216351_10493 [Pseudobutyrivibrio sp. JW11]|uniref:hypothetical protein n=1 Tax=Pseudobutyrivibrio sp. JW11 TaxID=1855302 RepID=UPI0008E50F6F|nr:hypothetical protein [Pseudobutyrivibrio sp. JW11]SFO18868.1 hypothetical protein SAMN05216351_10493 [Pseudobutyrivibrio sp. JW11]